jgi:NTE family protein
MKYKILALGGGGSKGILHVGALKVLEEQGKLIELFSEGIYGCSIGAAYAIAIAFGLDCKALERMSAKFTSFTGIFFDGLTLTTLLNSINKKGVFEMDNISKVFLEMLDSEGINLRDKKISDSLIPLRICATNITKRNLAVFQGDFPVMQAFLASACIPLIFCPQEINGNLYIDGGYLTNIILDYIPPELKEKTLSISIIHDEPYLTPKNTLNMSHIEFLYNLYKISCIYERLKNPHKNNIDLSYILPSGISDVSPNQREEMILRGSELTRSFFS